MLSVVDLINDDQYFLIYFIMGTYFGPDIRNQTAKKSVLERIAEGLPPYTSHQLTNSFIKLVEMERVYNHVLRNAHKSLIVNALSLQRYFQGQVNTNYPQFFELFPPELHPQSRFKNRFKVIHNVVFINNPDASHMKPGDVERFKRLSGLEGLHVDKDAGKLQLNPRFDAKNVVCTNNNSSITVRKVEAEGSMPTYDIDQSCAGSRNQRTNGDDGDTLHRVHVVAPMSGVPVTVNRGDANVMYSYMATGDESDGGDNVGPAMLFLPSRPSKKEWSDIVAASQGGFGLTGSAAMGQVGPVIGLMDIGECEDSYLFRVSLPGVKRDEREFSCEVGTDGKVCISGVTTTGEKMVSRYSQVFEMQTHNLCPPGKFSITFQLPGPVDPHQFSGNFCTDGILEGIVMKGK
ncbi:hypothetical protein RJT34_22924 [Clitoria ternatea]|uniref:SHSP domain-containing protein n=1 Tax=Clitoria ternatea TaxID=43366 RepID=A0AAN9FR37_CLITE